MKETNKLIKNDLRSLIKKFSKNDAISSINENYSKENIKYILNKDIADNRFLIKAKVYQENIDLIKKSLKENGIYNPFYVNAKDNKYEIVIGRRRLLASKEIGLMELPCIVLEMNDEEGLITTLSDIKDHKNPNMIEMSLILNELYTKFNYKLKDLSLLINNSIYQVSNIINLKKLPEEIFLDLNNNKISYGHAKTLERLSNDDALYFYEIIKKDKISVRKLESLINKKFKKKEENIIKFDDELMSISLKFKNKKEYKRYKKYIKKID